MYERLGTMRAASRDDEKLAYVYKDELEKIKENPKSIEDL